MAANIQAKLHTRLDGAIYETMKEHSAELTVTDIVGVLTVLQAKYLGLCESLDPKPEDVEEDTDTRPC